MFAIAFDLTLEKPKGGIQRGCRRPIATFRATLEAFGVERVQGSVYVCPNEDLANLFDGMNALKSLPWFPASVRDIQWSDFTGRFKRL
jgi:virulence-associated protein VapD